ncbi:hypothetical protein BK120_08340 [Paenibacillus sp. FSL A5-0031]|uniref:hypothetical protein n=1 Tax=Paenibacillus sp. FSL A5-0031 TaxID=1920420 RepID=UPI00096F49A8|nr:hypothetical protein [Paenibacillus sp. FSL A5-0031]OME86922.1 hypothetical protein BK120_08340 [Paenibacillus sp. FSL A5-0031]
MVVNELQSVEAFVRGLFPSTTYKQTVPKNPVADTFVIRLLTDGRANETHTSIRVDRTYQIVYYGATPADVLTKMDTLSRAIYQTERIPINASSRFIRVGAFSFSAPFQTDGDLYACIGVMETQVREERTQVAAPLIGEVSTIITEI